MVGAVGEPGDRSASTSSTCSRGQGADVLGDVVSVEQRDARAATTRAVRSSASSRRTAVLGDDVDAGDDALDLAADVGGVPAGPPGAEPGQHHVDHGVAVEPPDPAYCWQLTGSGSAGREPELAQLLAPSRRQVGAARAGRPCRGARRAHARRSQARRSLGPGSSPGCSARHAASYRSTLRPIWAARALNAPAYGASCADLAGLGVEGVAVGGERLRGTAGSHITAAWPMPLIASMRVDDPDRVQAAPLPGGEHAGVDLQVQVPVRVTGARGVVPHDRGLEPLDRHLHLPAARTDPRGRVLGQPADDLLRGAVLRGVVRRRRSSGCRAAASDQVFGPLTTTSTNRSALSSLRSRPFGSPVATS